MEGMERAQRTIAGGASVLSVWIGMAYLESSNQSSSRIVKHKALLARNIQGQPLGTPHPCTLYAATLNFPEPDTAGLDSPEALFTARWP